MRDHLDSATICRFPERWLDHPSEFQRCNGPYLPVSSPVIFDEAENAVILAFVERLPVYPSETYRRRRKLHLSALVFDEDTTARLVGPSEVTLDGQPASRCRAPIRRPVFFDEEATALLVVPPDVIPS